MAPYHPHHGFAALLFFKMNRYAFMDFETTGFSPKNGARVIEVGVVMVEDWRIVDTYNKLINPGVPVPREITTLTGITNNMIRNASSPQRIFQEAYQFVSGASLVAHNAVFEKQFWTPELVRLGLADNHQFLCTKLISRRLYPWSADYRLSTLVEEHNITRAGSEHRALSDAYVTAELFKKIHRHLSILYPDKHISAEFIRRYQSLKKADAKSYPKIAPAVQSDKPIKVSPTITQESPPVSNNQVQEDTTVDCRGEPAPQVIWWYFAIMFLLFFMMSFFG